MPRYLVQHGASDSPWEEVDRREWVEAARRHGFGAEDVHRYPDDQNLPDSWWVNDEQGVNHRGRIEREA